MNLSLTDGIIFIVAFIVSTPVSIIIGKKLIDRIDGSYN